MSFNFKEGVKAFFMGFVGFYVFFLGMGLIYSFGMWEFETFIRIFTQIFKSIEIARISLLSGIISFLFYGFLGEEIKKNAKRRKNA